MARVPSCCKNTSFGTRFGADWELFVVLLRGWNHVARRCTSREIFTFKFLAIIFISAMPPERVNQSVYPYLAFPRNVCVRVRILCFCIMILFLPLVFREWVDKSLYIRT